MQWHDFVGTTGAAIITLSYFLLQLQRISSTNLGYSVMNGAGAFLILISLWSEFNLSAFLIEAFWLAISIFGVIRYMLHRNTPAGQPH
jgi:multidrug transporter EmrE-like cation transporter